MKFEAHVMLEAVFDNRRNELERIAATHSFRPAKLFMQRGVPSNLDTFCTGHSNSLIEITNRLGACLTALRAAHFAIYRYKIEAILLDSRENDEMKVL